MFTGLPGARSFRQTLATECMAPAAGLDALRAAVACVARAPEPARHEPAGRAA
jgi:hypothetical protein